MIQTDYSSEAELSAILTQYNAHTVISMVSLDWPDVAAAQVRLIKAAAVTDCVKRFMPSEYNIDYDEDDVKLPYPEKKFHTMARRELEKTQLEYTYIYSGFFMDYFGMPYFPTDMRPLSIVTDIMNGVAHIPGDGNAVISLSYTKDVSRYIAGALELEKWPKVLTVVGSRITSNELVALAEGILGRKLVSHYDSIEKLRAHDITLLPSNALAAVQFPGGNEQLVGLTADLGAAIALGCYDFSALKDSVDLVKLLESKQEPMLNIETFMQMAWEGRKLNT